MTGRLIWRAEGAANGNLDRPPRAKLTLEGGELWFMDVRRFGTMRLIDLGLESGGIGSVAPIDPLSRAYTPRALARLLAGSRGAIKPWLMRQDRLAGIGNIYASEALCEARISPLRAGGTLDANEVRHLHQALRAVLRRAIRNGGTTFSDFQDSRGEPGRNRRRLKVYDREGEPCRHCGSPIARIVQSSRSTFYCPDCQQ